MKTAQGAAFHPRSRWRFMQSFVVSLCPSPCLSPREQDSDIRVSKFVIFVLSFEVSMEVMDDILEFIVEYKK